MRFLILLSLITSAFLGAASAEDNLNYRQVNYLSGSDTLKRFEAGAARIQGVFQGDSNYCSVTLMQNRDFTYGEFLFRAGSKIHRIEVFGNKSYKYLREESDESLDVRGWLTKDTIEGDDFTLVFYQQGDMGYTASLYRGGRLAVECDAGYK